MWSLEDKLSDEYRFTDQEILVLETVFAHNPYPNQATKQALAENLAVSKRKVYNWFVHKRSKSKQENRTAIRLQSKWFVTHAFLR